MPRRDYDYFDTPREQTAFYARSLRLAGSFSIGLFAGGLVAWHGTSESQNSAPPVVVRTRSYHLPATVGSATRKRQRRARSGSSQPEKIRGTDAHTRGPYYGDLEAPGEFRRMINTVSVGGEIVLLHGDFHRLRMLVNLIANLNAHAIDNILLLGFNEATCTQLGRRRLIGCAHSSFLWDVDAAGEAGDLARRRAQWTLAPRYVAWIQKFHYMRLLLEARVNILALDSDVVATGNPYPHLKGPFAKFQFITAFDTKGGFANINVGVVYTQNASIGGSIHGLFVEFERRVALGLRLTPPKHEKQRANLAVRLFWDQNLFNKVLLSHMINRDIYMPDGSDDAWTRAHWADLRQVGRAEHWRSGDGDGTGGPGEERRQRWSVAQRRPSERRVATPKGLTARSPWYPPIAEYKWTPLPTDRWDNLAAPNGAHGLKRKSNGNHRGGSSQRSADDEKEERILLAPPWLISADNALGHRYKHWMYGYNPPPCVLLHFVCVAAGERSRILPMQLFGKWFDSAVDAEVRELEAANLTGTSSPSPPPGAPPARQRIIALAGATIDDPLAPRPWPHLNALNALFGGLAVLSGRALVMPAINCTATVGSGEAFFNPGMLPNRCFWHVHTGSDGQVSCVFRLGGCGENMDIVSPTDLRAALHRLPPSAVPTITVDINHPGDTFDARDQPKLTRAINRLLRTHAEAEVVLVKLILPATLPSHPGRRVTPRAVDFGLPAVHRRYARAIDQFTGLCPELVDRSKARKRECTNVC